MLADQDRQKLDGIVQQMQTNKEPDTNIQAVVNDFKTKYDKGAPQATPTTPPLSPDQQSATQYKPNFAANTQNPGATEALKTIGNIPSSTLGAAKGVINFLNPVNTVPQAIGSTAGIVSSIPGAISDSTGGNLGGKAGAKKIADTAAAQVPIDVQANQAANNGTTATSLLNPVTAEDPSIGKTLTDTAIGSGQGLYKTIMPEFFQHLFGAGKNYLDALGASSPGQKQQSVSAGDTELQGAQRTVTNDPVGQLAPALLALDQATKGGVITPAADAIKSAASKGTDLASSTARPISNFAIGETATNALANGADKLGKAASAIPKALLGEEAAGTIDAASNPKAQAFQNGTNSLQQVAARTADAVGKFITDSKNQLHAVKSAIPDVPVEQDVIANAVNKGITDSVKHSADYRGVQGELTTPDDVVNKGVLDPQEVKNVNNMVDFVKGWKDQSARGVLNLKEALDRFHTNGKNPGSDAIVRSVQRSLKDVVGDVHPQIKPALEQASKNIDLADEMKKQLLGSNPATAEAKLGQVGTGLKDSAKNGYKLGLLGQLKALTGYDPLSELQGYHDYLTAKSLKRPSILEPAKMAKYVGTKALIKSGKLK